ncbi:putative enoyl CoA hydratase [Saguinus oedipus]|uniref:Enoyl CoA hydratase n=1 Tax=Saguinus oedipus TaxID=9490 RepID=A0ABQ9TUB8_SAGOE|nr:putative enoyl CoA hydratase [Saguinus oedipus]
MFTAGIDLMDMASEIMQPKGDDVARISWYFRDLITRYQETFTVIEKCPKPVIAAVHGGCIGGAAALMPRPLASSLSSVRGSNCVPRGSSSMFQELGVVLVVIQRVDLVTACDIRYCAQDAFFQVKSCAVGWGWEAGVSPEGFMEESELNLTNIGQKPNTDRFVPQEVDMGLAADVGTLQRLPRVIGNQSLVNELAFTARKMMADEALGSGLVSGSSSPADLGREPFLAPPGPNLFRCSRVFPDKEVMLDAALALATEISSKSPVAVQGIKVNLLYSRDHSVAEGLNHMASWNMSMLQTQDLIKSVQAATEKKELKSITFSKL